MRAALGNRRYWKRVAIAALLLLLCGAVAGALLLKGIFYLNHPDRKQYPVVGVDVSHWQGEIDWPVLAGQGIDFVFIKATEGSTFVDRLFEENWQQARETPLAVGAYHFFSYESTGEAQAENFNATVPLLEDALPPVVDVEFYGGNKKHPPEREDVSPQLHQMLDKLEEHYGKKPVIYATMDSYRLYIQGDFVEYPIWIRNIVREPSLPDGREWVFWQYADRGRLDGYQGDEAFIDLNVFCGTQEDWAAFREL